MKVSASRGGKDDSNYYIDNDEMTVYADNQLGYSGSVGMKLFSIANIEAGHISIIDVKDTFGL